MDDAVQEGLDVVRWPAGSPEEAHQLIYLPQIPKNILAWKPVVLRYQAVVDYTTQNAPKSGGQYIFP
jgi:hypothetical protein